MALHHLFHGFALLFFFFFKKVQVSLKKTKTDKLNKPVCTDWQLQGVSEFIADISLRFPCLKY